MLHCCLRVLRQGPARTSRPLVNAAQLLASATAAALLGGAGGEAAHHNGDGKAENAFVLMRDYPCARLITLNKPQSLNATDLGMQCLLRKYIMDEPHEQDGGSYVWERERARRRSALEGNVDSGKAREEWETFDRCFQETHKNKTGCVYILRGAGGRSFCAGGDVVAMIKDKPPGTQFASNYLEYQLDYYLWSTTHQHNAPHGNTWGGGDGRGNVFVSLWNGYVMGGGVGLSLHGHYRVATPGATFAMPEATIGFFPDVGASYFLPRLDVPSEYNRAPSSSRPGSPERNGSGPEKHVPGLGLYLGLTAARLKGADLVRCGLATHFLPDADLLPQLTQALCEVRHPTAVETVLSSFCARESDLFPSSASPAPVVAPAEHAGEGSNALHASFLEPEHLAVIAECFTVHPEAVASDGARAVAREPVDEKRKRERPESGIAPVASVEEVIGRLQAVHLRETSGGEHHLGGGRSPLRRQVAASFAAKLLRQLEPALTGAPSQRTPEEETAEDRHGQAKTGVNTKARPPPSLSPTSLKLILDMQKRSLSETDLAPALAREYAAAVHACGEGPLPDGEVEADEAHRRRSDFVEGVDALLIRKQRSPPRWYPATLAEVEEEHIAAFYRPKVGLEGMRRQPLWDPFTPFEEHTLV